MRPILLLTLAVALATPPWPYPDAAREPVTDTFHGVAVADPYRWLEALESPPTRAFVEAQERLTRSLVQGRPAYSRLRERLLALARIGRASVPVVRGETAFWLHTPAGASDGQLAAAP